MTFGDALQKLLDERGMSVYKLSKLSGISEQTLYSLVSGRSKEPSLGRAKEIATALGMTLDELAEKVYR